MMAKEEAAAYVSAERGDLVIKFAVLPPVKKRTVVMAVGTFSLPPLAMITSEGGFGRERVVPCAALRSLLLGSLVPAVMTNLASRQATSALAASLSSTEPAPPSAAALAAVGLGPEAKVPAAAAAKRSAKRHALPPPPAPASMLRAVLLIVGGEAGRDALPPPSGVAMQVMSAWKHALPQMRWRVIHMVRGTDMALLPDEETAVEDASVVVIEALHDGRAVAPRMVFDAREGKLVPMQAEPVLYETPVNGGDAYAATKEYRVVYQPGVRVRAEPYDAAPVRDMLRAGAIVEGSASSAAGWIEMVGGAGFVRAYTAAGPLLAATARGADAVEAESEEDEVVNEEKKVAWMRAEREYLDGGISTARGVLSEEASAAIFRCHCSGGVIVAVDHACSLLGRVGNEPEAESTRARSWPRLLPYLVGLPLVKPPASRHRICWRRLRSIAAHSAADDCSIGFAAIGLPPGTTATVRLDRGCAVWPSLGSAMPRKISAVDARERETRVMAKQKSRKTERDRCKALSQLEAAFKTASMPWPADRDHATGPYEDYAGVARGQCSACNACPGYQPATSLAHAPALAMLCVCCGCDCAVHEALRARMPSSP